MKAQPRIATGFAALPSMCGRKALTGLNPGSEVALAFWLPVRLARIGQICELTHRAWPRAGRCGAPRLKPAWILDPAAASRTAAQVDSCRGIRDVAAGTSGSAEAGAGARLCGARRGNHGACLRWANGSRAFSGLALVFALSFVNLVGILVTATALGGIAPWTRWQFIGMFGVVELASGLANILSPNIWRLPVAELRTSKRTDVKLAASALLLPQWGGLARTGAGLAFVV